MNKLCMRVLIGLIALFGLAIFSNSIAVKASSRLYEATPNLRGTWNRKYSWDHFGRTITIGKHSIKFSPNGHVYPAKFYVVHTEHYRIWPKNMQGITVFVRYKKLYGDIRPVLNIYCGINNSSPTEVYYKGKKVVKSSDADTTPEPKPYDLSYNNAPKSLKDCIGSTVYIPYGTDSSDVVGLAGSAEQLTVGPDSYPVKITTTGTKMTLKGFSSSLNGILDYNPAVVEYNGQTYYTNPLNLVPYNTDSSNGVVISSCKPDDPNVVLKNGQHVNTSELWSYTDPSTGKETDYTYSVTNNQWEFQRLD